jgi:hypothetical protein
MSDKPADYGREVRDTVVKSGLTGVAATVLAVTVFSPAGLGGVVGVSSASNVGGLAGREDPYADLPPFPSPLTGAELEAVQSELARTAASLEITRAATDARIDFIRSIAFTDAAPTLEPVRQAELLTDDDLRSRTEVAEPIQASTEAVEPEATLTPVSYTVGGDAEYLDPHLELAELLLAHDKR